MKLSVDPKALYYFVKVAEYRSFTRAAESLGAGIYLIGPKEPVNRAVRTFWQVAEESQADS